MTESCLGALESTEGQLQFPAVPIISVGAVTEEINISQILC